MPQRASTGLSRVTINLYQDDKLVAQTGVSTELVVALPKKLESIVWNLVTLPLQLITATLPTQTWGESTPAEKPRRETPQPGSVSITQNVRDSSDVQTFGVVYGDIHIGERGAPTQEETPSPTPSGGHVYIAYSHDDRAYVTEFKTDLRARGFAAWSDEDIEFGQDREEATAQALEGCAVFVVVMSESSARSDTVKAEIEAAARLGKPIFPLWLSGEVFPGLARLRPADVRSGGMPPRAFYEALRKTIGS